MPLEPALRAMLTQTIQQQPYTGMDMYGKPSYGPPQERPAYMQLSTETIADPQGQARESNTLVICDGDFPVSIMDRIVLPDGSAPALQAVAPLYDPDHPGEVYHWKLRL